MKHFCLHRALQNTKNEGRSVPEWHNVCQFGIWIVRQNSRRFSGVHKLHLLWTQKFSASKIKTKTFSCEHKICRLDSSRFSFFTFTRFCVHQRDLYFLYSVFGFSKYWILFNIWYSVISETRIIFGIHIWSYLKKKKACCAGCRRRPFPMKLHQ